MEVMRLPRLSPGRSHTTSAMLATLVCTSAQLALGAVVLVLAIPCVLIGGLVKRWLLPGALRPQVPAHPRSILITGASDGIGAALALYYSRAEPGVALALVGRSQAKLQHVAEQCRDVGAGEVRACVVDVTNESDMRACIEGFDDAHALDLVIANAGVSELTGGVKNAPLREQARLLTAVNLVGVYNTVFPAVDRMKTRRRGQIAITASLGGFGGLPAYPLYTTTKTAVRAFADGLRGVLARDNIGVSSINPGYVATAMTAANKQPMPFIMTPARLADLVAAELRANTGSISCPVLIHWSMWLLQLVLPDAARDALLLPLWPVEG